MKPEDSQYRDGIPRFGTGEFRIRAPLSPIPEGNASGARRAGSFSRVASLLLNIRRNIGLGCDGKGGLR